MAGAQRRKREKESKKNAILKAARKLFFEYGFKSVTVDKIAEKVAISKGSIYLHFHSKEEIYTQILINDNITFHERLTGFSAGNAPASEQLFDFARIYVSYFLDDKELFRIFMAFMLHADQMDLHEEQNSQLVKITNANISVIGAILQKGIDSGEFSPAINVRQEQNAIWGLLNGIISLYLFTGKEMTRSEKITSMVNESLGIFIKGLKKNT